MQEYITEKEKKSLFLNEINLTNEIRYQIIIARDAESREKFRNLLEEIESLRKLEGEEYILSLKENFQSFKEEANEIIKAKQIEQRLNGFVNLLNDDRNILKDKRRYISSWMHIKDNKFLTSIEK